MKITNDSLSIKEALTSLTTAATIGLDVFLFISLVGSILILCVFSYSAYSDDKKESAILTCLGAKNSEVVGIFTTETLIVTILSFIFSTILSFVLQPPLNKFLGMLLDLEDLIKIPFSEYLGVKGLLPVGIFVIINFVALSFSYISISINKKLSVKKELSDL